MRTFTALDLVEQEIRAETDYAKRGDAEAICVWAVNMVQSKVRGHREEDRVAYKSGFTVYPPAILATGSGFCGSCVIAWRAILGRFEEIEDTRQIGFYMNSNRTHVAAEALYDGGWHFFDVQTGAFWQRKGFVLGVEELRTLTKRERRRLLVENSLWTRYNGIANPYEYLDAPRIETQQ